MFGASLVLVLRAQGDPEEVNVHDFIDPEQGRATPYGVYDLQQNEAWVSGGISHDTAEFAVQTIRTWWNEGLSSFAWDEQVEQDRTPFVLVPRVAPCPGCRAMTRSMTAR